MIAHSMRPAWLALLTVTALACFTGAAHAASSFDSRTLQASVTIDTAMVTPTTRRIVAKLTVAAGSHRTVVGIEADSPRFYRFMDGKVSKEGTTLRPVRLRTVGPPGRMIFDGGGTYSGPLQCDMPGFSTAAPRGGTTNSLLTRGIILRPRQSVTLFIDYDIASDLPWIGTNYAPLIRMRPVARDVGDGTKLFKRGMRQLKHPVTLRPPAPLVTGPFAARIDISNSGDVYSKEPGVIKGSVVPAVAGRTVNFSAVRMVDRPDQSPAPVAIGSAVTAADGSFAFSAAGLSKKAYGYAISASYPAQDGGLLAASPCPFEFLTNKVTPPPVRQ